MEKGTWADAIPAHISELDDQESVNSLVEIDAAQAEIENAATKLNSLLEEVSQSERAIERERLEDIFVELAELLRHLQSHCEDTQAAIHQCLMALKK